MAHAWNEFKLRISINTPVEKVYKAWATPAGLESWFLRKALILAPGDTGDGRAGGDPIKKGDAYEWWWHGHYDLSHKGAILDANGKDQFRFSFSLDCPVTISLYRECDETIVELRESDMPADEEKVVKHYLSDLQGWVFYLTNLKSVLEGGIDLRNRKRELKNVINS
ncbi:MAG: SRPBCC domain-containing protein [Chitinophagaceae bacterium]|nr:SRPBCC domain-containing protein [Chitinophagaceae bacterium]